MDTSADIRLLDKVKEEVGLETDADLAAYMGISRTAIHNARTGKTKLSPTARLKVLDRVGFWGFKRWADTILPDNLAQRMDDFTRSQAQKIAQDNIRRGRCQSADAYMVELMKAEYEDEFPTDEKLAEYLGLKRSVLSMVRSGKTTLGIQPRARIWNKFDPFFDIKDFESTLGDAEKLIGLIEKEIHAKKAQS